VKSYLNIDHWPRKNHFHFFKGFTEPFFGIVADVDCTEGYRYAKQKGVSFFLYYLHKSLAAANEIESFRYRIEGEKVACYDVINAGPTVPRPDGTFGFSEIIFKKDFEEFYPLALAEMKRVSGETTLVTGKKENVIYYSAIPWIKFTSVSHARHYDISDSIPKISFGKIYTENEKRMIPVSVHVHHALMDGYHVGQYFELFQKLLNNNQ
jgi:chloramphenicol O-acetyltransferase type A